MNEKIKEDNIYFKSNPGFFDIFNGSYYAQFVLKIDGRNITSLLDWDYISNKQTNRLKNFVKKYSDILPNRLIEEINSLK